MLGSHDVGRFIPVSKPQLPIDGAGRQYSTAISPRLADVAAGRCRLILPSPGPTCNNDRAVLRPPKITARLGDERIRQSLSSAPNVH